MFKLSPVARRPRLSEGLWGDAPEMIKIRRHLPVDLGPADAALFAAVDASHTPGATVARLLRAWLAEAPPDATALPVVDLTDWDRALALAADYTRASATVAGRPLRVHVTLPPDATAALSRRVLWSRRPPAQCARLLALASLLRPLVGPRPADPVAAAGVDVLRSQVEAVLGRHGDREPDV